ncbi:ATP-binding cassette domain-containing protein [Rhodanobacter denitrificans]|uniref:ATP-binding cassette domain-containing protein n=1 Tax=Rhodanobacter denitrificans TaxID=666685 RepID=UPI000260FAE7|nr:ATP-binding cassette domain-containing protein [Rhodanobacter denitrificans]EIM03949.1 ABC transporter ATP-binding protein [Rhodanobacter denitrificans]UJM91924.1 ATP-binding cassette domain-containing protein [Rhodanobacter denitrificans]
MSTAESAGGIAFALVQAGKRYGRLQALEQVSLAFAAGTTTALIGSSGSGKSTVLRLLLGLEWPDHGHVEVDGRPLQRSDVLPLRRRVGYVIQDGGLFPHLTALGNLALLPRHLGWKRERIRQRAEQLAALTHLPTGVLERYPAELSGGQRQRVALMRALMADPDALLLDEPLGALDPVVRHELQDELKQIFDQLGKTVIVVTHDLAEAAWFAERLVLLRQGAVLQDGTFRDLRERPADAFVNRFVAAQRRLLEAP